MDLNSSQKLFLHGVLFHYLAEHDTGSAVRSGVEEIMSLLEEDLSNPVSSTRLHPEPPDDEADESDEEDFEVEDESDEEDEPHLFIDVDDFLDLPEVRVTDEHGRKSTFRFFDDGDGLQFELFSSKEEDAKSTYYGPVRWVRRFGKSFLVMSEDNEQTTYSVSKFPTEWTSLLRLGEKTGA